MAGGSRLDEQWQSGVEQVVAMYRFLPHDTLIRLQELAAALRELKGAMQALVEQVDAAVHCAGCGGECCVAGKYHFTRADFLVYLVSGEPLFRPLFGNGMCPYLGVAGCLIPAAYRPFNCITFNCELIEDRLSEQEISDFYRMEHELKNRYAEIRSLFPDGSMNGALLTELPGN